MRRNSTARAIALFSVGLVVAGGLGVGVASSAVAAVPAVSAPASVSPPSGIQAKTEVLAYLAGDAPGVVIRTVATGSVRTILAEQTVVDPAISPDATKLAYTAVTSGGPAGLYVEPVDESSAPVLLVTLPAADSVAHPHWSPDGTKLVYTRIDTDSSRTEVVVDSSTGAQLGSTSAAGADATIEVNERQLLSSEGSQILLTAFNGTSSQVIDERWGHSPLQSPNANRIDFVHITDPDPTEWLEWQDAYQGSNIGPVSVHGVGEVDNLFGFAQGTTHYESKAWAADSQSLFVAVDSRSNGTTTANDIYRVTRGGAEAMTSTPGVDEHQVSAGAASRTVAQGGSGYVPVTPVRILDTRTTLGGHRVRLGAGKSVLLTVAGKYGVPAGATAVNISVTAIAPTASTAISVTPGGTKASSHVGLRAAAGANSTTSTTVPLDSTGAVLLHNSAGSVYLTVDLTGYYSETEGYGYTPVLYGGDTSISALGTGWYGGFAYSSPYLIPWNAVAVTATVVTTAATEVSHIGVSPIVGTQSTSRATTTVLSVRPGVRSSTELTARVGSDGGFAITTSAGTVNVRIYITGYFSPDSLGAYEPTARTRVFDSRGPSRGSTWQADEGALHVASVGGVPAQATAAITSLNGISGTHGTAIDLGPERETAGDGISVLIASGRQTTAGTATLDLDFTGSAPLTAETPGTGVVLVADVLGYYAE